MSVNNGGNVADAAKTTEAFGSARTLAWQITVRKVAQRLV